MYIDNLEFLREIIICKGRGNRSNKLDNMFILVANNYIRKKIYLTNIDKEDCINDGLLRLFTQWKNFDEKKYTDPFAYFTEVFKRGTHECLNKIYKDNFISLDMEKDSGKKIFEI